MGKAALGEQYVGAAELGTEAAPSIRMLATGAARRGLAAAPEAALRRPGRRLSARDGAVEPGGPRRRCCLGPLVAAVPRRQPRWAVWSPEADPAAATIIVITGVLEA